MDVGHRGGAGGVSLVTGGRRTGNWRAGGGCARGFGGTSQSAALIQHGIQHIVGHTLLLEINNFARCQAVDGAGILDVTDDDAVADLGLHELQDLRNAVGKLRRRLTRHGGLGWVDWGDGDGGILCDGAARHKNERSDGGDGQKRISKKFSFHNQHP